MLDLGCGQGMHSLYAARMAGEVIGVDSDKHALYLAEFNAKWEGIKNVSFIVSGVEASLPFLDGSFDLVMAFDIIEHLKSPRVFLSEIRRVLTPGGTLLLSAPNSETTYKRLKKSVGLRYYSDPTHLIEYTRAELEEECLRAGFACRSVMPVVLDTPFYGLFDFIGGISLPIYERLDRYKRSAVTKRPQDTTGFRMVLERREGT
jgi:2-polyprenyl-3-methyl-5-hydroxy-6-metoxy-1,4-benzoquinol methylase